MISDGTIAHDEAHQLLDAAHIGAYMIELRRVLPPLRRGGYYAAFRHTDDPWRMQEGLPLELAKARFRKLCAQAENIKANNE
jgi:hypothetical protein